MIERQIQSGGKSRAWVGNRPATAALLRDLAPHLGDIHGQHDPVVHPQPDIDADCHQHARQHIHFDGDEQSDRHPHQYACQYADGFDYADFVGYAHRHAFVRRQRRRGRNTGSG